MILGCDIGTGFTKAVLLEDGKFLCGAKTQTEANPEKALQKVLAEICAQQGIHVNELREVVADAGIGDARWGVSLRPKPPRGVTGDASSPGRGTRCCNGQR